MGGGGGRRCVRGVCVWVWVVGCAGAWWVRKSGPNRAAPDHRPRITGGDNPRPPADNNVQTAQFGGRKHLPMEHRTSPEAAHARLQRSRPDGFNFVPLNPTPAAGLQWDASGSPMVLQWGLEWGPMWGLEWGSCGASRGASWGAPVGPPAPCGASDGASSGAFSGASTGAPSGAFSGRPMGLPRGLPRAPRGASRGPPEKPPVGLQ